MLSNIYSSVMKFRNFVYDKDYLSKHKVHRPVISIGNITVGGTGKTPITDHFILWAAKKNIKVGVVSRGYGGSYTGVQRIPENADPQIYGDEPTMLSSRNPNIPIYVCGNRVIAAQEMIRTEEIDLVLADDAFQHRRLIRDIDIVVIDLLENLENYKVIPQGRAREPLQGLKRADYFILNKANFVSDQQIEQVKQFIEEQLNNSPDFIIGNYLFKDVINFYGNASKDNNFLLVSGIGNPKSFEKLIQSQNIKFADHITYRDHHSFSTNDIKSIEQKANENSCNGILCTEKDAIKLKGIIKNSNINWFFAKLEVELLGAERLYDKITSLCS